MTTTYRCRGCGAWPLEVDLAAGGHVIRGDMMTPPELCGPVDTILRDRRDGLTRPLTLAELRSQLEQQPSMFSDAEWGGCGCFIEGGAS